MKAKTTDSKQSYDLEQRVGLLEYQFNQVVIPVLNRIETMQTSLKDTLNGLRYVETKEFDAYQKDAEGKFATKDDVSGTKKLVYWILGLAGSVFLILVAAFVGVALK